MEFEEMFKSEQDCIDYLVSLRCQMVLSALNVVQFDSGKE